MNLMIIRAACTHRKGLACAWGPLILTTRALAIHLLVSDAQLNYIFIQKHFTIGKFPL